MTNFPQQYLFRIVGASLGAFLHLFVFAIAALAGGEGPTFALLYIDFPIVFLWNNFIGPVGGGGSAFFLTWIFGGTLMYALAGWVIGGLGDWLVRKLNK